MNKLATFAGGCFWCMVKPFDQYEGVGKVVSGYTGGHTENPTYEEVCSDTTGHIEAIQITFDDEVISYEELLNIYWKQIDPTDSGGQFNDRGHKYKTVIFYHDEEQKELAYKSKRELEESKIFNLPIVQKYYQLQYFMKQRITIKTIIRKILITIIDIMLVLVDTSLQKKVGIEITWIESY